MENLFQATSSFAVSTVYHPASGLSPSGTFFSWPHRLFILRLSFDKAHDFVVDGLSAHPAEMDAHPVGGGADPFCKCSCFTSLFRLHYRFSHRIGSLRSFDFCSGFCQNRNRGFRL